MHELTSEVNSGMRCVAKIMAMPGTRQWQICACSGWLRVTREDQGLSTQVCGRSPTRDVSRCACEVIKCTSTHRHAQTNENNAIEKEQTGTWVRHVARAMEEQLREDKEGLETHEQKKKTEDAKRIRGLQGVSRVGTFSIA